MAKYRYEALLRPPHERVAAVTYFSASAGLIVASEFAFLVPSIAYAGAAFFIYRGSRRWLEARRIIKYQKGIRNLPLYVIKSEDLKISYKQQYLGQGFKWTTKHAQRLYDLELTKNEIYEEQSDGYKRVRSFCYQHEGSFLADLLESHSKWNPWRPLPDLGGRPALHAVGMLEGESEVLQPIESRVAHTLVQGTTRVGKTRLAEVLIAQDIARGDVVIVFDPKGDADLFLRCYTECKKAGRLDNFYGFHLGFPEESAQYNPIGNFLRLTEVASRIANQMPGEGQSLAFKEFVWGYVNQITKGIVGLGKTPTYELLKNYSQDMEPLFVDYMGQLFQKYIGSDYKHEIARIEQILPLKPEERKAAGLDMRLPRSMQDRNDFGKAHYVFFLQQREKMSLNATEEDVALSLMKGYQTDQSHMAKLVASLDPFLAKMTTGAVSKLIAPDFKDITKDTFSWSQIIQSGGVVYVGLDALSDAEVAATVGNSMFSDLTSVAGRLYKHGKHHGLPDYKNTGYEPKICLHADEFNELAGAEFIPMLNKAGGAGVQVTAYTQTAADIRARLGDLAKAQQMEGNFNTLIMLRVLNEETARLLTDKQRKVTVSYLQDISGAVDNPDIDSDVHFTSSTQTRDINSQTDLIRVADLSNLPKGQAFAIINGSLYKLRIPWIKQSKADQLPDSIAEVASGMRDRYKSVNDDWYQYKDDFNPITVINKDLKNDQTGYDSFVAHEMQLIGDPNEF